MPYLAGTVSPVHAGRADMNGVQMSTWALNNATPSEIAFRLPGDKAYILVLYILPTYESSILWICQEVYRLGNLSSLFYK
jgi:hypothetical protein